MSHLVILGLGARSTLFYQKKLHELYFKKFGGYTTLPFLLKQLNFNHINPHLPHDTEKVSKVVSQALEAYNSPEFRLLMPNMTLHKLLDNLNMQLQIIHPFQLLKSELKRKPNRPIVIFGTRHTSNSSYIGSYVDTHSLVEVVPETITFLDNLRQKVYAYSETAYNVDHYNALIAKYARDYIVVIACTELSVVNNVSHENVIDLVQLQCQESINMENS